MAEALNAVAARLGVSRPGAVAAVFGRWEELVGSSVSMHVHPLKLQGATLVVTADHPAWATQIRHLAPEILARLAEVCPPGEAPERLEIRVRA
ncbi:MAG: DciA family protein [Acidimicrobiales bacterium]